MSLEQIPNDLPVPEDDSACNHLTNTIIPEVIFNSTNNGKVNVGTLQGATVIYIYPMTGQPDVALPNGWDSIPGARGCTPQSCSSPDLHDDLKKHARILWVKQSNYRSSTRS